MTNRIWKLLGFLLIACLLLSGVSALAESGKVTVHLDILAEHLDDKRFTDATGIEIEIFKVGEPVGGQGSSWAPTKDFTPGVSFEDYDTDENGNKVYTDTQVKQIVADVEAKLEANPSIKPAKELPETTQAVHASDPTKVQVVFDELDPGIYYIRKVPSSRPRKMKSTGTLISIPSLGKDNQDVVDGNPYELNAHIKYTFDPIKKTNFPVTKHWDDDDDFDGIRPDHIDVTLYRTDVDGQKTKIAERAIGEADKWSFEWKDLDAEDENEDLYTYSVEEKEIPSYEQVQIALLNGTTHITNPHTPDYGCIEVTKEVTVGGKTIEGTTLVDGIYAFTITGPTELENDEDHRNDSNYLDAYRFDISIVGGKANTWSKPYVKAGTYVIEEIGIRPDPNSDTVVPLPTSVVAKEAKVQVRVENRVVVDKDGNPVPNPDDPSHRPMLNGADSATIVNNLNAGSLTVTKAVTLNGAATDDPRINGTYRFTVTGPTYVDPFEIEVKNGKSDSKVITDLVPGVYTVTESSDNLPVGVSIARGSGVTYTVNAGANTDATVTNNLGIGSLRIVKTVTVNGVPTTSTRADGTYTFTVKGPSYPSGHKVSITIKNGASSSTQLDNLLVGEYTVSEDTSSLPSGMSLRSTNDLRLNVTGGTVTDASFTNNIGTPTVTPPPNIVVNPTPTPLPNINITGQKIWNDENNLHNVRPTTITVQLLRNGSVIRETNVTGNMTAERWTYRFTGLPQMNAQGEDYVYTVRELPVTGYTTNIDGFTITNDLIPRTPNEYTNFNGTKTWDDSDNMEGLRPNYIIVRLMRDGEEVDRRTVTGANSWQYTFQNVPLDDGYGHTYEYTISEDPVTGYVGRIDGFDITNSRLPEDYGVPLAGFNEPEMEDLMELYDYETPQWGRPLKTGDEMPLYPIVFGGIGLTALVALAILIVIGKKREKNAA